MLPAVAQDTGVTEASSDKSSESESPNKDNTVGASNDVATPEDESNELEATTAPSAIITEINQALEYIRFTPLERALYAVDNLPEGKTFKLTFEPELLKILLESAQTNNHPCIVATETPPEKAVAVILQNSPTNMAYWFVKASLYEAAGREGVKELLEKGVAPLMEKSELTLPKLPKDSLFTIILFLAAYKSNESVEVMLPYAFQMSTKLTDILTILEVAHRLDLADTYQKVIEAIFRLRQKYNIVESIFFTAKQHGRLESARYALDAIIKNPYPDFADNLKILRLLHQVAEPETVADQLKKLAAGREFGETLDIAKTSAELDLRDTAVEMLTQAVTIADSDEDFRDVINTSTHMNLFTTILVPLADRLKNLHTRMLYDMPATWPDKFAAQVYDKESISLGIWLAAHLYANNTEDPLVRELFETTIQLQLNEIIDSVGAKPLMKLNDLYGLVYYYSETNNPGMQSAGSMLGVQRFLRGLSEQEVPANPEDARLLALQMALDQEKMRRKNLQDRVASLTAQKQELVEKEMQTTRQLLLLVAEISAKVVLLIIAIWIAFARAVIAAKTAPNFRFSNFCFTFTETIGLECCCTVILVLPGMLLTLISQDRLKHLRIMEYDAVAPLFIPKISKEAPNADEPAVISVPMENTEDTQ